MPWWSGLDPEILRRLRDSHPGLSLEDIGIAAVRDPRYAAEFERLDVTVWTYTPPTSDDLFSGGDGLRSPDDPDELEYYEKDLVAVQALIVAATLDGPEPRARRPRHRPPDAIPIATVKRLMWDLAQRKAQRKARPRVDPELTQEKIGERLELNRSRVQQAEALERVGWDLLRSHPEFSADDGFVRWPSAKNAARLMAPERAEN